MQIERINDPVAYTVSGGLITYGWVGEHLNEIAILFGMLMGLLTFISGVYFKKRRENRERSVVDADEKRKQELHEAKLNAIAQNSRFLTEYEEEG